MSEDWGNPYDYRSPALGLSQFFGREKEIQELLACLIKRPISVYGEHRIGLTSFLLNAKETASKVPVLGEFKGIYADLRALERMTPGGIFLFLLQAISADLAARCRSVFLEEGESEYHLATVFREHIGQAKLIFFLDEADVIAEFDNPHSALGLFIRQIALRSLGAEDIASSKRRTLLVLGSSSHLRDIEQDKHDHIKDSGYYQDFHPVVRLGPLDIEGAMQLIIEPGRAKGINLIPLADSILELVGTHPMFLQMACYHAIEELRLTSNANSTAIISATEKACCEEGAPIFEDFWNTLSVEEKNLLEIIEQEGPLLKWGLDISPEFEMKRLLYSGYVSQSSEEMVSLPKCFAKFVRYKASIKQKLTKVLDKHTRNRDIRLHTRIWQKLAFYITVLGAILLIGGVVVAIIGRQGQLDFRLFGQQFSSVSIGAGLAFIGAVFVVISFRRLLKSIERALDLERNNINSLDSEKQNERCDTDS